MNKLKIEFENCYGIKKLSHTFDFSKSRKVAIYAPNGIMKTSFANTFSVFSEGKQPIDRIYRDRTTNCLIQTDISPDLNKDNIFVIAPLNETFKSNKISTLLVNSKLKKRYDSILEEIIDKKHNLIKLLKNDSGLKSKVEETLADDITHEKNNFFLSLESLKPRISPEKQTAYEKIKYSQLFSEQVMTLLNTEEFKQKLEQYIEIYDSLISNSQFFRKGVFNHTNAKTIAKNLKDQGFLKAGHSVSIKTETGKVEITETKELEKAIQNEMNSILKNDELSRTFSELDKRISANASLRTFRDYVENNQFILSELNNIPSLKQKIWVAYLTKNYQEYNDLLSTYLEYKDEINNIISQARLEQTKWHKVVETFNSRFSVPFVVEIDNQDDVILKEDSPIIKFKFSPSDNDSCQPIEEQGLWEVLSNGECRALYLLNIIFEINARRETDQETVFIIDDIADSFDYKNKYAIIEYLNDIAENQNFYQIILTHNFDFYRSIASRLNMGRKNRFYVEKSDTEIKLIEEKYQNNPFTHWKANLHDNNEMLIASIPFVRNLAEYCSYDSYFKKLTALLHIKSDTKDICISTLENIYKEILQKDIKKLQSPDTPVYSLVYSLAENICNETEQTIELEKKIVLSIAIRLKAEEFLIGKIHDTHFISSITKNQTRQLIDKYKILFPNETANIELLEKVSLMTPENIHLNSFMYEPILDMSNHHLKQLFQEVSKLLATE